MSELQIIQGVLVEHSRLGRRPRPFHSECVCGVVTTNHTGHVAEMIVAALKESE